MRWYELFADLERQFEAGVAADRALEVAELTRAERAGVELADRLREARGRTLDVTLRHGSRVGGELLDVGGAWLLLADRGREHLVPLSAVVLVDDLGEHAAPPPGPVARRLGLGHALRAVARDRTVVRLTLVSGGQVDGRVGAVGTDHLDLALVRSDSGRPSGAVRTVPFSALDLLSSL